MSLFGAPTMSLKFLPCRLRTTLSKATEQIRTQKMQLSAQGCSHLFLQLSRHCSWQGLQAPGGGQHGVWPQAGCGKGAAVSCSRTTGS